MKFVFSISLFFVGALALSREDLIWEDIELQHDIDLLEIEKRIVGGEVASPNQFPYQVGLRMIKNRDGEVYRSWCGGSLISSNFVLTAAHCLENAVSLIVYLGAHNRVAIGELKREMIQVKKDNFIIHENYDPKVIENDIALIKLEEKVKLNQYINIVNLPSASQTDLAGLMATASGWGKMGDKKESSDVLRFVQRKILENDYCKQYFGPIISSQLCLEGTDGKSTCQGDSGGPLVIEENDGTKVVVGLTSFGRPTCEKGYPVVFTRVSSFLDWINKHTGISVKN